MVTSNALLQEPVTEGLLACWESLFDDLHHLLGHTLNHTQDSLLCLVIFDAGTDCVSIFYNYLFLPYFCRLFREQFT